MPARFILHIIVTIILLSIGWWLYMSIGEGNYDSLTVATYWFAALVFILFSWLFYWFVHRLQTKAWLIALVLSAVIAAIATSALLFYSQKSIEQTVEETGQLNQEDSAKEQSTNATAEIETLDLGEE